jgi:hypothetical protein
VSFYRMGRPRAVAVDRDAVMRRQPMAPIHITIDDNDDRPERMVRDPDRYFADARRRARQELARQAPWLFSSRHHQEQL